MQWLLKYHDALRTGGLIVVAMIGIVLACWRNITAGKQARIADQQAEIAMKNHLADAYTRAIDQLGKEKEAIQLGGLYALEKIADSNESYYRQIIEVLCAFIRLTAGPVEKKSPKLVGRKSPAPSEEKVELTVQTALTILGRINLSSVVKIDLSGIKLCNANFFRANFSEAYLSRADLSMANLFGANLKRAYLRRTNLRDADLSEAILIEANLFRASLIGANLERANLSEAKLSGADFSMTSLIGANLSEANLSEANLPTAILLEANLSGADLSGANLSMAILLEANLSGTNLEGTILIGADLSGAGITLEQLQVARVYKSTKLPDHIDPKSLVFEDHLT